MEQAKIQKQRSFGFVQLLGTTALGFTLLAAAVALTGTADSQDQEAALASALPLETDMDFATVTRHTTPALVHIQVEKVHTIAGLGKGLPDWGGRMDEDKLWQYFRDLRRGLPKDRRHVRGQGSGFIIDPSGYILTNSHVIGRADTVTVTLSDGREWEAKIVGSDPKTDVAVIKIDGADLPVLPMGDSDKIEVGQWVLALGSPFGLTGTVTSGIVSATGRSSMGITDYEDFIQTDAAINPGNSGGPLVNLRGEAIGINTAIVSRNGGSMGVGFAIPINMAKEICDQLISDGSVTRGHLGVAIQNVTPALARSFGLEKSEGVLVGDVVGDSPAEKAGMEPGDIILSFNGHKVSRMTGLRNLVARTAPESKVKIVVHRDGEQKTLQATIGQLSATADVSSSSEEALGLSVAALNDALRNRFGYAEDNGVVVTGVHSGSAAELAGIRPGMLIREVHRRPIQTPDEFASAVADARESGSVLLLVSDGTVSRYIVVRLDT